MEKLEVFFNYVKNNNDIKFNINYCFDHYKANSWSIAKRVTPDNMLVFCRGGSGFYFVEGQKIQVKPNRIIFVARGDSHFGQQDDTNPISVVAIRFSSLINGQETMPSCSYYFDIDSNPNVYFIFENIIHFTQNNDYKNETNNIICHNLLNSIFWNIIAINSYKNSVISDTVVAKAVNYIDSSLRQQKVVSLGYLLTKLSINKYQFSKKFISVTGKTFKKYLFEKRLELAKNYILSGEYTIKQISTMVGYSDQYIFSNQFKKFYGKSPSQFK